MSDTQGIAQLNKSLTIKILNYGTERIFRSQRKL